MIEISILSFLRSLEGTLYCTNPGSCCPECGPSLPGIAVSLQSASLPCRPKYLGVSPPISTDAPSEQDVELTEQLEKVLRQHNVFDTPEGIEHRYTCMFVHILSPFCGLTTISSVYFCL